MSFRRLVKYCLLLLAVSAIPLAGCDSEQPKAAKENMRLRLGLALQPTAALLIIAEQEHCFAQEGLEIVIKTYPSGKRALKDGLLQNEVDVISSAEVPLAFNAFTSMDTVIFGSTCYSDSIQKVIARRDAGVEVAEDLQGKRIATQRGSAVHYFWHQFHQLHSITEFDLSFMKAEFLPGALIEGKIDAFSMREPFIGEAQRTLGENSIVFGEPGVYVSTEVLATSRAFLEKEPEALKAFLRALLRAEAIMAKSPDRSREIVTARLKADPKEMDDIWPRFDHRLELSQSLLLNLEDIGSWAIQQEVVTADSPPDYVKLLDSTLLQQVAPERVSLIQ